jgi:Na+-translocating ferredoxin:NAD+ oxidoreductase subunit A
MPDAFPLLIGAVLANHFVLTQFLGVRPLFRADARPSDAWVLTLATTFVVTVSAIANHLLEQFVLRPFDLEYLRFVAFVFVIAVLAQGTVVAIRAIYPAAHHTLGPQLPLITINCAVLALALLASEPQLTLLSTILHALGATFGFTLAIVMFAALSERLDEARVPAPFRGAPIQLVIIGVISLAFTGFKGIGG